MKEPFQTLDPMGRRQFIAHTARAALGVNLLNIAAAPPKAMAASSGGGKAKHCIFLYMSGAMSQYDTFDPKPKMQFPGVGGTVKTTAPGVEFSGYLPKLAKGFDDLAVVRSLHQKTGVHQSADYWLHTSYAQRATIIHPSMGPWAQHYLGKMHDTLPDTILVGNAGKHPGAGFFSASMAPLPVANPEVGVRDIRPYEGVDEKALNKRLELANVFDRSFRKKFQHDDVHAYNQFYDETLKLMKSEDLDVFDLSKEPNADKQKERYGKSRLGNSLLLAKRLVKSGVRFVEVQYGNWDMHYDIAERMAEKGPYLDNALSALIEDLKSEGLFDETLIALGTEFGRTAHITSAKAGRDHSVTGFSSVFAGGGISGGQVHGETNENGKGIKSGQCTQEDFNATIGHAMGLDIDKIVYSPSGRPFLMAGHEHDPKTDRIVSKGKPLPLFS